MVYMYIKLLQIYILLIMSIKWQYYGVAEIWQYYIIENIIVVELYNQFIAQH